MNEKKLKAIDLIFFAILLIIVSIITFKLFYNQVYATVVYLFPSDMKAYILNMQGLDSGYSFPYPIFFKISAFINLFTEPELAVAIATMLLNGLAMCLLKCCMNKEIISRFAKEDMSITKEAVMRGLISIATVALFFSSMLFDPFGKHFFPGIKFNYLGVFTSNPYHNATYMAARPFAIIAFFAYARLIPKYENGYSKSLKGDQEKVGLLEYVWFSVALLAATMTKPSFTLVLVGTAGILMLYRMIASKFKNFWPTIYLGLCFIPTFIDLLYQYSGVFVPSEGEVGGVGFGFARVWGLYCDNIFMAIALAIAFPIIVFIFNYKEYVKNSLYRFALQLYICGFMMNILLYEKGFREPDFNFSWGYMYGIFFAFVGALILLIEKSFKKNKPPVILLQWLAYIGHVICGICYFYSIYCGNSYYN